MEIIKLNRINESLIKSYMQSGKELIVEFDTFSFEENENVNKILLLYLESIGKEQIFDFISYCLKELYTNAEKANNKRVYFSNKNLNIEDKTQYYTGMKSFKTDAMSNFDDFVNEQTKRGFYVRLSFCILNDNLEIKVKNNINLLEEELTVINERREMAKEFKTIDEALSIVLNNEEGAGLGIIISILMLKKLGLTADSLSVYSDINSGEAVSQISIPLSFVTDYHEEIVNEFIINELKEIPHFPDNIIELQNKLNDPYIEINNISLIISKDSTLTSDILKFINSAYFMLPKKVSSITEAIKYIGLKGLRNLIYSYGTQTVLSKKYDLTKMQNILEHSYKVALISFYIAKIYGLKDELEDIYISGILHDIGKILLLGVNPKLIFKINNLCHEKGIPLRIIEDMTSGYNHSKIGSMLASKWNFPEKLIDAIENHHTPNYSDKKYRKFVSCVYIADYIYYDKNEHIKTYNEMDKNILSEFKINTLEDYEKLYDKIKVELDRKK